MITVRCIVDNMVLRGSALWGEHGVAFWIETLHGNILFDTGQSGEVLVHNAELMHVDLRYCDSLVLSHAHYDHTGGLEQFFNFARQRIPLYASPHLFRERYSIREGEPHSIGLRMSQDNIHARSTLHLSIESLEIMLGIWTTGEILERLDFEGRSPQHFIRIDEIWQPDPYQDDLSLILHTSQGLLIICGCCHAGLTNTLAHVLRHFPSPIRAVIGGTHLETAGSEALDRVITALQQHGEQSVPDLYLNHCTGEHAFNTLLNKFGKKVNPCPAGTVLQFE
jgi:7,8-dihydropterin-6-yl-methyl-4-(beta-D-ribofuranosyl)aminobenzene 5'-phosphate synthase